MTRWPQLTRGDAGLEVVHGAEVGGHGQQVLLEGLLHEALVFLCHAGHGLVGALARLLPEVLQGGGLGQLLLPQSQHHGPPVGSGRRGGLHW